MFLKHHKPGGKKAKYCADNGDEHGVVGGYQRGDKQYGSGNRQENRPQVRLKGRVLYESSQFRKQAPSGDSGPQKEDL